MKRLLAWLSAGFVLLSIQTPISVANEAAPLATFSKSRIESGESLIAYLTFAQSENPTEIRFSLVSPSNTVTQVESLFFKDSESSNNLWLNVLNIASDAETGTWGSLITFLDSNQRRVNLFGPKLEVENPATVKSTVRDIVLSGDYFAPGDALTVTAGATTSKGVRSVNLVLVSPRNQTITFDQSMKRVEGSNFIGIWQTTVSLPETSDSVGTWTGRVTLEDIDRALTTLAIPSFKVETAADVKSREDAAEAIKKARELAEAKALAEYEAKIAAQIKIIEEAKRKLASSTQALEAAEKAAAAARERARLAELEAAKKQAEIDSRPVKPQTTVTPLKTTRITCIKGKTRVLVIDVMPKCPKGFKRVKK